MTAATEHATTEIDQGVVPAWDVADRMRKALRESGLTGDQMAVYLGVSRSSVTNWLGGRFRPSTQTLRLWALRTGISFDWLCEGDTAEWQTKKLKALSEELADVVRHQGLEPRTR